MTTKRIVVLANSIKHHPMRCVAGRELVASDDAQMKFGGWIRPVSTHDEGALSFGERCLVNGRDSRPLDIVRLDLDGSEKNPLQPENWIIRTAEKWVRDSAVPVEVLTSIVEAPANLWFDPTQKSDRASGAFLQRLPNMQSLYLIRPEGFQFHVRSRVWEGHPKKQQRGLFTYKGRQYDFALTDPLIGRKYFPDYPRTAEGYIQPKEPRRILLCVSLTPPFHDLHYKVIATVFELSA